MGGSWERKKGRGERGEGEKRKFIRKQKREKKMGGGKKKKEKR